MADPGNDPSQNQWLSDLHHGNIDSDIAICRCSDIISTQQGFRNSSILSLVVTTQYIYQGGMTNSLEFPPSMLIAQG